jgi:DNA topoisomerase II
MAQDFVGSNNINLLVPSGQFGTRLAGGSDAASARYIFTSLSPITRCLFPEEDDALLTYREDDGQLIEPVFFCPIIPLLLVNGASGIGTGWSSFIPPCNPRDIISYIRAKIDSSRTLPPIRPWVRGFVGDLDTSIDGLGFISFGVATIMNATTLQISELPVGKWTNNYKKLLLKMREKGDILSFVENHTTTSVNFTVTLQPEKLTAFEIKGIHKAFGLQSSLNTRNMNAFDASNIIKKFETFESMADAHFSTRLALYHDRKSVLESDMNYRAAVLRSKAQFILAVADGKLELTGKPRKNKSETIARLEELEFIDAMKLNKMKNNNVVSSRRSLKAREDDEEADNDEEVNFDYLLNLPLSSLTSEKIDSLFSEAEGTEVALAKLKATTPEDLWRTDLEKLESHL